jgi:hypothetical protein
MTDLPAFVPFPKIPRLNRLITVTEKIDGTNASVHVFPDGRVQAASRNRWITPENDNYGFARWVHDHEEDFRTGLGEGAHFGEWWGPGIQRGYGINERRFSLFNAHRWGEVEKLPFGCHVVPVLGKCNSFGERFTSILETFRKEGSKAAPGYMNPEGIVAFHVDSQQLYKVLLESDHKHKGELAAEAT